MRKLFPSAVLLCGALVLCLAPSASLASYEPPIRGVLKVAGETKYKPYTLVRLKAEGADPKAGLLWRVYPAAGVQRATSPRGVLEFVAPPGVYQVDLLVITSGPDGALNVEEQTTHIEIESPTPKTPDPKQPDPSAPKTKPDPLNALGRIQFGSAGCTATVIGPRRSDGKWDVLTAAHCISGVGQRGTMALKDGRKLNIRVTAKNSDADCAWCVTDESPADLAYAEIATEVPPNGTPIWHAGYGVDRPGNREDGATASGEDSNGQIRMNLSVSSGDSGGGIFRTDTGELVSVVCCTRAKGVKTDVWGASPLSARKLRSAASDHAPDASATVSGDWVPLEVPSRFDPAASAPGCCPAK